MMKRAHLFKYLSPYCLLSFVLVYILKSPHRFKYIYLLSLMMKMTASFVVEINVNIPINRMDLVNLVHEEGEVFSIKYYDDVINIRAAVPAHLAGRFEKI